MIILTPHQNLQPYIQQYVYTEMGASGVWTRGDLGPPGCSGLTIVLESDSYRISVNGEEEQYFFSPVFTGQINCFSDIRIYGRLKLFIVLFKPWGAYRLLGVPQNECTGNSFHLSDLLGIDGKRLSERLGAESSVEKIHQLLEQFLLRRLSLPVKKEKYDRLTYVSDQIMLYSHDNDLISKICRQEGYSMSSLERHMNEIIGMPPKKFQRILRFNNALKYINHHRHDCNWSQIANRFGYYDQSHFIKEFKFFFGKTPEAYEEESWLMKVTRTE